MIFPAPQAFFLTENGLWGIIYSVKKLCFFTEGLQSAAGGKLCEAL
jgi:hypothetical protein